MNPAARTQSVYAEDRLAGLIFSTEEGWCIFRPDCGFTFNHPLDAQQAYALVDPETDEFIGIRAPGHFAGLTVPPLFRVFRLHPLVENLHRSE